jgi:hypothetical protein
MELSDHESSLESSLDICELSRCMKSFSISNMKSDTQAIIGESFMNLLQLK